MCKIDTILSPMPSAPKTIKRVRCSMSIRQIQYNSDVLRELARLNESSLGSILPRVSQTNAAKVLRHSYKDKIPALATAKQMLKYINRKKFL